MARSSLTRRRLINSGLAVGASASSLMMAAVRAQAQSPSAQSPGAQSPISNWPSRPIRLIVPWPAGGLVDIAARQVATRLQAALGQSLVVENRIGAGGNLGSEQVARAPADGYTLLFATSSLTVSAALDQRLAIRAMQDLQPIAHVANAPSVLVAGPSISVNSVAELLALAQRSPGKLTYASAGVGSFAHLVVERFKAQNRIFAVHVPYTGAPAAMNDQLAGRIDFQMANITVALPHVKSGRVKAQAITSKERFPALPEVPTMIESGQKDFEADQWLGLLAPQGLPANIVERLNTETNRALADTALREALERAGMRVASPASTPAFALLMQQDLARWQQVVKQQGIRAE